MSLDPQTNALLSAQQRAAKAPVNPEDQPLDPAFPYVTINFPVTQFGSVADPVDLAPSI